MWLPEHIHPNNRASARGGHKITCNSRNLLAEPVKMLHSEWGECPLQKKRKKMRGEGGNAFNYHFGRTP